MHSRTLVTSVGEGEWVVVAVVAETGQGVGGVVAVWFVLCAVEWLCHHAFVCAHCFSLPLALQYQAQIRWTPQACYRCLPYVHVSLCIDAICLPWVDARHLP